MRVRSDHEIQVIEEQFGILKDLIQTGEASYDDVYKNLDDYIDPVLCKGRAKSLIFLRSVRKRLRACFPEHDEDFNPMTIACRKETDNESSFYRAELAWCLLIIKGLDPKVAQCPSISEHLSNIERSIA